MGSRPRRKSLDNHECSTPKQKTVSQRACELFAHQRKRLTFSGGRRSRILDTLEEVENHSDSQQFAKSPPKKAKRLLGLSSSPSLYPKICVLKNDGENDTSFCITPGRPNPRHLAPLATLFDDPEDLSTVPCTGAGSVEASSSKTPIKSLSEESASKNRSSESTPLQHSIPSSIGRSLSVIRATAGRSLQRLKMQASAVSLTSVTPNDSKNNNECNLSSLEKTPTKRPLSVVRQLSSSSVSKAANALLKGLVTGPRNSKSKARHRLDFKENDISVQSKCRFSVLETNEDTFSKQCEKYERVRSAINVIGNRMTEIASSEVVLYDAIVCDITPTCQPISEISELILSKVGEEVLDDIDSELVLKKKFVMTESGNFKACKYIFFVVDYGTPGYLEKTWQDIRFVFHNFIEKAIEHEGITSLLLPYLYTGEPKRNQEKVANAAISSINHLVQQIGLGNIEKLDIGGVVDGRDCYNYYLLGVKKMLSTIAPKNSDNSSQEAVYNDLYFDGANSSDATVIDDSLYLANNTSGFELSD